MGLPWVDEHPDVFSDIPVIPEEEAVSPRLSAAHFRTREVNVVTSSGDSGHITSDQEEIGDEYEDTLTTEGNIFFSMLVYLHILLIGKNHSKLTLQGKQKVLGPCSVRLASDGGCQGLILEHKMRRQKCQCIKNSNGKHNSGFEI